MAAEDGRWHRVCLNTIVRKGMALDSERLRILPMGSKVWVVEQVERRVRIDRPIKGWCSLKSSNGDTILTPLEQTGEEQSSTPSGTNSLQQRADEAKAKYNNASKELATKAANMRGSMADSSANEMLDMVANGELTALQAKIASLKEEVGQKEAEDETNLAEFERALKDASEAKMRADALKTAAEMKMRELNLLKEQFVEMFTKMEGDTTSQEPRPIHDGGVLLLQGGDIVFCRFKGEIPESGEDGEWLGVLYDQPFGNSDGRFTTNGNDFPGETRYMECVMNYGAFVRESDVRRRLFADELLYQLTNAMNLFVANKTAVEGSAAQN